MKLMKRALGRGRGRGWLVLVWALSLGLKTTAADYSVSMEEYGFFNFRFRPSYLEIQVGDTVTWMNNDYTQFGYGGYGAVAFDGPAVLWSTGLVFPGQSRSITFPFVATYDYEDPDYVSVGMTGTLVVKPATPPQPSGPVTLVAPQWLADGRFQCLVSNLVVGATNIVQASPNVSASPAQWTMVSSNIVASSVETFTDDGAAAFPVRFYRAWQP